MIVVESENLEPIKVAGLVRVAAKAIHTNSASVSVNQNTLKIGFNFESSGTEFKLALAQPVGAPVPAACQICTATTPTSP